MYGHVRSVTDKKPIAMIKVSVFQDRSLVGKAYTDEEGRYTVDVPTGEPVTVLFDTHWSLTNAEEWHPSLVANVIADDDSPLDRYLVKGATGADTPSTVDLLSGYLFAAVANDVEYARPAASRLSSLKVPSGVLHDVQRRLQEHFEAEA
ncbi:carboxypeptidase regulatory-like domain-containing protein [Streptomyces sp. NPDC059534]|uniref:carboxypeptidase regulatory-like domain-containing protein n=1 Tax=Streptomyces sp. NPDC059534 TaxID=3346859 RepID=UPI0036A75DD0